MFIISILQRQECAIQVSNQQTISVARNQYSVFSPVCQSQNLITEVCFLSRDPFPKTKRESCAAQSLIGFDPLASRKAKISPKNTLTAA